MAKIHGHVVPGYVFGDGSLQGMEVFTSVEAQALSFA